MFFITRFFDRRKVWKLLPDYPVYTPLHKGGWEKKGWMAKAQAQDNYAFFLHVKDKRIQKLAEFLVHFDAKMELTHDGLVGLSRWLYRYEAICGDSKNCRYESVSVSGANHIQRDVVLACLRSFAW